MAEHLGHLGAEFLVMASRIRIEGVYRADLAFIERMGRHVVEICERGGLPWLDVGHLYLGLAAHWRGAWEAAERHLATALATAEALGNRIEQADLGFWRSRMLRDRDRPGDRAAAAALATEVATRYRDLGLQGRAERGA